MNTKKILFTGETAEGMENCLSIASKSFSLYFSNSAFFSGKFLIYKETASIRCSNEISWGGGLTFWRWSWEKEEYDRFTFLIERSPTPESAAVSPIFVMFALFSFFSTKIFCWYRHWTWQSRKISLDSPTGKPISSK